MTQVDPANCIHPVIYDGICTECGTFVTPDSRYNKTQDIYVLASTIGTSKIEPYLLKHKKLALVVDLDKTLIDTIGVVNAEEAEKIIAMDEEHRADYFYFNVNEMYLVRLRPYVREFLKAISPLYFMQVYTLAQRQYALQVIQKIDPDKEYFNERILTREDSPLQKKSISDFFLSGQHLAVVIDDSRDPWSNPNGTIFEGLVQVEGFNFFSAIAQPTQVKNFQFIPKNINMEALNEHYLERMTEVMTEIHSKFYELQPQNVATVISDMKKDVFKDCYIYFCKIWLPGEIAKKKLYIGNAEEYGGHVLNKFLPYTTHIVTTDPIHEDVVEAQNYNGIYIVNYKWFFNSVFRYQRQSELDPCYTVVNLVNRQQVAAPLQTTGPKPRSEPVKDDINGSEIDDLFEMMENNPDTSTQTNTDSEEESNEYGSSCDSEDISFLYKKSDDSE